MPKLSITSKVLAFSDPSASSNPLRKNFDCTRAYQLSVDSPKSAVEVLPAAGSVTFFNGIRSTTLDGTSAFTVTLNATEPNRYRFTHVGGTVPGFRTNRLLTLSGQNLTVVTNADATVNMTLGGGTWASTSVGDTVFIPGPTTGDSATPFNLLNEGFWVVLAVISATNLQLMRPAGADFQSADETVAVTANSQVQAFTAAGVQPGDSVEISAGFSPATWRTFEVDRVTQSWFEVIATSPIPLESAKIPGAAGMVFYSSAKCWVRVETDQEIALRLNGVSDDKLRVSPIEPGSTEQIGWFELKGPVWSLVALNKSSQPATVTLFSAE